MHNYFTKRLDHGPNSHKRLRKKYIYINSWLMISVYPCCLPFVINIFCRYIIGFNQTCISTYWHILQLVCVTVAGFVAAMLLIASVVNNRQMETPVELESAVHQGLVKRQTSAIICKLYNDGQWYIHWNKFKLQNINRNWWIHVCTNFDLSSTWLYVNIAIFCLSN